MIGNSFANSDTERSRHDGNFKSLNNISWSLGGECSARTRGRGDESYCRLSSYTCTIC